MSDFLITGGTGPMGRKIAAYLAKDHNVVVTSRRTSDINLPNNVKLIRNVDLLSHRSLIEFKKSVKNHFATEFSIINCVGYFDKGQVPFLESPLLEDEQIIDGNFKTVYNTAKMLLPLMIEKGGGHFITFSCNSVRQNYPWMLPYTASKAAIEALTKGLANEHGKDGILANTLALSTIDTENERKRKPFGDHEHWLDVTKVAKCIENIVVANNPYVNGNIINLFDYSPSYYHSGYFERIRKDD